MNLSKLWEMVKDGENWHAVAHEVTRAEPSDWTTTHNFKWSQVQLQYITIQKYFEVIDCIPHTVHFILVTFIL